MTEKEWLTSDDPEALLESLHYTASDRKCRLIACACCRAFYDLLDADQQKAVDAAERFADGALTPARFRPTARKFGDRGGPFFDEISAGNVSPDWRIIADCLVSCACIHPDDQADPWDGAADASFTVGHADPAGHRIERCHAIRCVFGNPLRPVTFEPDWRTSTVVALAEGIYADRAFDRLPILADALEDAGCDHPDILAHCRGTGPHVRGCWVVDLVLGKE